MFLGQGIIRLVVAPVSAGTVKHLSRYHYLSTVINTLATLSTDYAAERGIKHIFNQNLHYYTFYIEKLFIRYCFIGIHFSSCTISSRRVVFPDPELPTKETTGIINSILPRGICLGFHLAAFYMKVLLIAEAYPAFGLLEILKRYS